MIRLTHIRTHEAIPDDFCDPNRSSWVLELLEKEREIQKAFQSGQLLKHSFISSRWKAVRDQLFKESKNKCAYCEANTKVVAYGDVEHYRPKSKYWWLAYCYDNYVVACAICNQKHKRDHFPILAGNTPMCGPTVLHDSTDLSFDEWKRQLFPDPLTDSAGLPMAHFETLHQEERPLLLNPYFDEPSTYFAWQAHEDLKQVWLVPANEAARPFVQAAEAYYGLNRTELKELRYNRFLFLRAYHRLLLTPRLLPSAKEEILAAINLLLDADSDFAGMLRYFNAQWQVTPP